MLEKNLACGKPSKDASYLVAKAVAVEHEKRSKKLRHASRKRSVDSCLQRIKNPSKPLIYTDLTALNFKSDIANISELNRGLIYWEVCGRTAAMCHKRDGA